MKSLFLKPIFGRNIHESHRTATSLELLYDLCFVVAIAVCTHQFIHAVTAHHIAEGFVYYVSQFFAIWWAWMTYSWLASAYDNQDWSFRVLTTLQMFGVLILAVGLQNIQHDKFLTVTIGYSIMRLAQVILWIRVARSNDPTKETAKRYAIGTLIVQALWIARLYLPEQYLWWAFGLLVIAELAVPVWAAKKGETPWHAHHIAERFGLLTIIVLGEGILGISKSIGQLIETDGISFQVFLLGLGSLAFIVSLWWLYFLIPFAQLLHEKRQQAFKWGYLHFLVFMSVALVGGVLSLITPSSHSVKHHLDTTISILLSGATAVYLLTLLLLARLFKFFNSSQSKGLIVAIVLMMIIPILTLLHVPMISVMFMNTIVLMLLITWLSRK